MTEATALAVGDVVVLQSERKKTSTVSDWLLMTVTAADERVAECSYFVGGELQRINVPVKALYRLK